MVLLRIGLDGPGDPARTLLGGAATPEQIEATTERYHLDSNILVQYFYWLKGMLTGDFGYSVINNLPVADLMEGRVMTTLLLGFYAMTLGVLIAVPLGVYQAYRRDRFFDKSASYITFLFISVPGIVLAVFLKLIFIEGWELFPRLGDKIYPWEDPGEHFRNFFLPTMTLAIPIAAVLTRLLRADMSLTLQSDFISLARAKGMPPRRILLRHALRNSLFSLVTAIGVQLGALIGGAVIAETFFDLDGMGTMLITAVLSSDLFTVQATVAILVTVVVLVNLCIDLLYAVIDPRIRMARSLA